MKIAFQMDPIGPIDINADSTFRLAEEAQALKVHRDRIEGQLKQAQDELAVTRGSIQDLTSRLQETESESAPALRSLTCTVPG